MSKKRNLDGRRKDYVCNRVKVRQKRKKVRLKTSRNIYLNDAESGCTQNDNGNVSINGRTTRASNIDCTDVSKQPVATTHHTLPRATPVNSTPSPGYSSLPRTPKPPRKPSGYVSPAAALRRPSRIEMLKGLKIGKLEQIPELLKKTAGQF